MLQKFDSLELTEEKINAITDQIPQRPVTLVEGTSYMAVIIAAFTVRRHPPRWCDAAAGDAAGTHTTLDTRRCPPVGLRPLLRQGGCLRGTDSLVLCLCCQVLGFFVYNFVTNFILEPTYQTCFNSTLQKLKQDPRITVRLGNDIVGGCRNTAGVP